jgi:4-hydroxythreonine-4-phosphate dehydrogenase
MSKKEPKQAIIGITMGDPAGVGAEIILKALAHKELICSARFVVYGSTEVMKLNAAMLNSEIKIQSVNSIHECKFPKLTIEVIDCSEGFGGDMTFGRIAADNGELAYQSIVRAIDDAREKHIDATVTAILIPAGILSTGSRLDYG